jgi:hypothetical protein
MRAQDRGVEMTEESEASERKKPKLQWNLFFGVLALGIVGMVYVLLRRQGLNDSAALYLGIPLILALAVSLLPASKSAMGATMKGMTIALLMSSFVFQEGYICIIFSAPIFYAVGALIAGSIDYARKRKDDKTPRTAAIAVVIALLSLEGTTDATTFPRENEVTVSKIVDAPVGAIRDQLSKPPYLEGDKPAFLRIFPYPTAVTGQALKVGDEQRIVFVAYKHIWWTRVEGALTLRVSALGPDGIKFVATGDDSYLSHYLEWQSSEVALQPIDANHTRVTWTLAYRRNLDPSWYFGPMQHYAVHLAAEELIDHVATPRQ